MKSNSLQFEGVAFSIWLKSVKIKKIIGEKFGSLRFFLYLCSVNNKQEV